MIKLSVTRSNIYLIVVFLFSACASPRLTNNDRGNYVTKRQSNIVNVLEVNVSVLPLPKPPSKEEEKPKTFFDLRDSIPHKFLEVVGDKASTPDDIIKALKSDLSIVKPEKAKNSKSKDASQFKLRLLFSNIKKYFNQPLELLHPNTRLEFLNTTITTKDKFAEIYTIDRLENQFELIDMGTLERTNTVNFSSKLSGEYGSSYNTELNNTNTNTASDVIGNENTQNVYDANGNLLGLVKSTGNNTNGFTSNNTDKSTSSKAQSAKAEVNYANAENIKENLAVKFKKIKTGFSFSPYSFTLSQRGSPLRDIDDNIFVTLTFKINNDGDYLTSNNVTSFGNLYDKTGKPSKIDDLIVSKQLLQYSPCSVDTLVKLGVKFEGAIRAVKNEKKGRNSLEWDDKVVYHTFSHHLKDSLIISSDYYCQDIFKVQLSLTDAAGTVKTYTLRNISSGSEVYVKDDLIALKSWLLKLISLGKKEDFVSNKNHLIFYHKRGDSFPLSSPSFAESDLLLLKSLDLNKFSIAKFIP